MSKNVIIAGSIAAACSGLALVAFLAAPNRSPENALPPAQMANNGDLPAEDPFAQSRPALGQGLDTPPAPNNEYDLPQPDGPMAPNDGPIRKTSPDVVSPPIVVDSQPPINTAGPDQPQSHTVAAGDSLGEISMKYYGTSKRWKDIKAANPGLDEGNMPVGKVLVIPVLAPAPEVAVTDGERTYTVQKNDTYFSIAASQLGNGARWKELEKLNRISAENLRPGKVIKLPAKPVEAVEPEVETPADGRVHVVAKGETLGEISQKHYGTSRRWKDIQKANPKVDPENMMPGTKLVLPDLPVQAAPATGANLGPASTVAAGEYVVVAADNSLMDIARKTLGDAQLWKKIQDANPGINARKLRVGQKLVVPGYTGASSAPEAPRQPAEQPLDVLPPPLDFSTPPVTPPAIPGAGATAAFQPIFSDPLPPGGGETFGRALP